jgi:hypothetical protein
MLADSRAPAWIPDQFKVHYDVDDPEVMSSARAASAGLVINLRR